MSKQLYSFLFAILFIGGFFFNSSQAQVCTAGAAQTFANTTPVAIVDNSVVTSTITVSGGPTYIYNLKMITNITHTFPGDLDITITSPAGTVVTLTSDNAGSSDDVFAGTTWDDKANPAGQVPYTNNNGLVGDHTYATGVVATPLVPEEPLGAFIGENANGVWTLRVGDDAGGDVGTVSSWSLVLTGLTGAPILSSVTGSNTTPVTIVDNSVVTSTITISGAGTQIFDVNALTNIVHTFSGDMDITLTSPAGTVVTLSTDNAAGSDDVFNGTLWDDDANPAGQIPYTNNNGVVTDHLYVNAVVATPLTPEEALAAFIGENPNGVWTLRVADDAGGDVGTINSWSLDIKTSTCGPPPTPCTPGAAQTFTNTTPVSILDNTVVSSTITVSGAPAYLYDLNMMTNMTHTFSGDLDVTITSPAGTVVTITSDNGAGSDNVYAGTMWDDKASAGGQVPYTNATGIVTDHLYANLVVATPLTPEEAFAAFIGENPNGTWTIRVGDDAGGDVGILNSWSLIIQGLSVTPVTATTTATNNTSTPLTDLAVTTSTITIAGAGTQIFDVDMITNILHTFPGDMDITLTSPAGTVVTISSDNAGSSDDVFNGTTWDDDANPAGQLPYTTNNGLVTDHSYATGVVATPLVPEEALGAFIGENPNGVWTLRVSDDAGGDVGTLTSWSLSIKTSLCPVPPCTITCPANVTVNKTAGQCGAVVNYTAPTTTGTCGAITAIPAAGTVFPIGTTTVNVTAGSGPGAPTCSFTVTVVDTEIPAITTQPVTKSACANDNPTFTVVATNAVSYQWQVNSGGGFTNIAGATGATLTLTNVQLSASGSQYRVIVNGPCTSTTSNAATLTVNRLPVVTGITAAPYTKFAPGQLTSLTATYDGFPVSFTWYRNGVVSQVTVGPTISNLPIDSIGNYRVELTDNNGCKGSASITLSAEADFRFFVYPTPNNGQFQVRFYSYTLGARRTLRVYDAKGSVVFNKEFTMNSSYERMDVDISKYTKGVYHIELRDASGKLLGSASTVTQF